MNSTTRDSKNRSLYFYPSLYRSVIVKHTGLWSIPRCEDGGSLNFGQKKATNLCFDVLHLHGKVSHGLPSQMPLGIVKLACVNPFRKHGSMFRL